MVLIYGAYGYTGKIIVEEALKTDLLVTIAGRDEEKLKELARKHELPYRAFELNNASKIAEVLKDFTLVIHCAGPFEFTAMPMARACLLAKTHYLDITGEYQVFQALHALDEEAKKAGIMFLPGAGFDVVPSDCLAAQLKDMLPKGEKLTLAFTSTGGSMSRGTSITMIENIHKGQQYRKDHKIESRKHAKSVKEIDFGEFKQIATGISWGDISSAYYSTGIPNIEVLSGTSPEQVSKMKWLNFLKPLLKMRWVKNIFLKQINKKPAGPSAEKRAKASMYLWGKIEANGTAKEKRIKTLNGYSLTAKTAILIATKVMAGDFAAGYQTPSTAYGKDFIFEVAGCEEL